jgi:hypothetical protein
MDRLHRVHFDNRQYNFVLWRPDQLPQFKAALQFRIEATVGRGPVTSTTRMCGRYALQFGLPVDPGFGPRCNIAPVGRK